MLRFFFINPLCPRACVVKSKSAYFPLTPKGSPLDSLSSRRERQAYHRLHSLQPVCGWGRLRLPSRSSRSLAAASLSCTVSLAMHCMFPLTVSGLLACSPSQLSVEQFPLCWLPAAPSLLHLCPPHLHYPLHLPCSACCHKGLRVCAQKPTTSPQHLNIC